MANKKKSTPAPAATKAPRTKKATPAPAATKAPRTKKAKSIRTTLTLHSNNRPIEIAEKILSCSAFAEVLHPGEDETHVHTTVVTQHGSYNVIETPEQVWAAEQAVTA